MNLAVPNRVQNHVAAALLVLLCAAPFPLAAQDSGARPPAGINAAQAQRGEATFKQVCASCHTSQQFTAPQHASAWNDRPIFELFDQLRSSMPQDEPGRLSAREYLDVAIYLLKLNGAALDEPELAPDEAILKQTRIRLNPEKK